MRPPIFDRIVDNFSGSPGRLPPSSRFFAELGASRPRKRGRAVFEGAKRKGLDGMPEAFRGHALRVKGCLRPKIFGRISPAGRLRSHRPAWPEPLPLVAGAGGALVAALCRPAFGLGVMRT